MSPKLLSWGVAAVVVSLSGCTDLIPIQNQVNDLRGQVSHLSSQQGAIKENLDGTARSPPRCRERRKACR